MVDKIVHSFQIYVCPFAWIYIFFIISSLVYVFPLGLVYS